MVEEAPAQAASGVQKVASGIFGAVGDALGKVGGALGQIFQPQREEVVQEVIKRAEGTNIEPAAPSGIPDWCNAGDLSGTLETTPECYPEQRFESARKKAEQAGIKVTGDPTDYGISLTGAPDLSAYTVLNQVPVSEEEKEAARKSGEALAKFVISLLPGGAFPELVEKSDKLSADAFVAEAVCKQAGFVDTSYVRSLLAQTPKSGQKQRQEVLELGKQVNPQFAQQIKEARKLTYEEVLSRAYKTDPELGNKLEDVSRLSPEEAKTKCGQETAALEAKIKDLNSEVAANTAMELAFAGPVGEAGVAAGKAGIKVVKPVVRRITDPIGNAVGKIWDATAGRLFRGGAGKVVEKEAGQAGEEAVGQVVQQEAKGVIPESVGFGSLARTQEQRGLIEDIVTGQLFARDPGEVSSELIADFLKKMQYPEEELPQAIERVKDKYLREKMVRALQEAQARKVAGQAVEPGEIAEAVSPGIGARVEERVAQEIAAGRPAAEVVPEVVEREAREAAGSVMDAEAARVAEEAAGRATALAEKKVAEEAAAEAAAGSVREAIGRIGGQELVPAGPVSKAVAWIQDAVGGLFGRNRTGQEAAGLTRQEAAGAIEEAAQKARQLVREGKPVEEAVAEAVDGSLGKALGEIVDEEAKDAGRAAAQSIAEREAAGKVYFKDRRRTGAGTVAVTQDDELVTTMQFEALEGLYRAAPENVAKPIGIIREGDKIIGYEMEFVDGMSAKEFIEKNGSLTEELRQKIRTAVDNLHEKGVAHGDLNPGNIMITPDGQVKFIDPFPYSNFRPEDAQRDIGRLAGWLNSDKTALPKEGTPQAFATALVAQKKTEEAVAKVGGRIVGVLEISTAAPANPVARAVQSVTNSAKGAYGTIGRVFERRGKEIGKEAGEQVAREAREAVESVVPAKAPRSVASQIDSRSRERLIEDLGDVTTIEPGEIIRASVKDNLDQITPDNLGPLLQATKNQIRKEREAFGQQIKSSLDPSEALSSVCMGNSASHALTCAVNSREDHRAIKSRVEELAKERRIGRNNPDLAYTTEFFDRHIEMVDLEIQLFDIDTARRISIAKGEPAYFENALKDYPKLTGKISKALDEFEKANAQLIRSLPRSEQEELARQISELRQLLSQQDPNVLREIFYDKIIVDYKDVVFANFEVLNEAKLRATVRNLQEAQGGGIFGLFKRTKPTGGEGVKNVPAGVGDFVDDTLGRLTRRGEPEQVARIQPTREPIAERTVANLTKGGVNEDAALVSYGEGIVGVFDGAGGHASGEVASGIARNSFDSVLKELPERPSTDEVVIALKSGYNRSIKAMQGFAGENPATREMATTVAVAKVFEEAGERRVAVLSVGDSRVYVVRKSKKIEQLTQDEGALSIAVKNGRVTPKRAQEIQKKLDEVTDISQLSQEEALYYNKRNQTNLLTPDNSSAPRVEVFRLARDADYVLIMSDGVHDNLTASQIEAITRSARSPQEAVDNLVAAARENAGRGLNHRAKDDDITAVAMDVGTPSRGTSQGIMTPAGALKNPDRPMHFDPFQGERQFDIAPQKAPTTALLEVEDAKPLTSYSAPMLQEARELAGPVLGREATSDELVVLAKWAGEGISSERVGVLSADLDEIYLWYEQAFKGYDQYGSPQFDFSKFWELRRSSDRLSDFAGYSDRALFFYGPEQSGRQPTLMELFLSGRENFRLQSMEAIFEQQRRYKRDIQPVLGEVGGVFKNYVDYLTGQGFNGERYKHLEGMLDPSAFWIVPKDTLDKRGILASFATNTGQISFAVEYLDRLKTITHECVHRSVCLARGYGSSSEKFVKQLNDRLGPEGYGVLAKSNPMDDLARNVNEGLTEWLAQQADGMKLPSGKIIQIPAEHKTYPEEVDAVRDLIGAIKANNPQYSDEFIRAMMMDAALTGDVSNLLNAVGVERFINIFRLVNRSSQKRPGDVSLVLGSLGVGNKAAPTFSLSSVLANLINGIRLVTPVYAEEIVSILDTQFYELQYKKLLLEESFAGKGKLDPEEVVAVARSSFVRPLVHRVEGGYQFITGKSGSVGGNLEQGKYKVEIASIPGVDIKIPGVIDVKAGQSVIVPVAVKEGSGKVEKKGNAQGVPIDEVKETGKVTIVVFADKNNNGKFDKNEDILPWAGLTVELKRVTDEKAISLEKGDNKITLPVLPDKLLTASILLREIALQGGEATSVSIFENGFWKTYVAEGAKAYSFEDFPILPGKSYSIKSRKDSAFLIKGQEFVTPR